MSPESFRDPHGDTGDTSDVQAGPYFSGAALHLLVRWWKPRLGP